MDRVGDSVGPEGDMESVGVKVAGRAEAAIGKIQVLILQGERLKTARIRRYVSCQVEIGPVLQEWDR